MTELENRICEVMFGKKEWGAKVEIFTHGEHTSVEISRMYDHIEDIPTALDILHTITEKEFFEIGHESECGCETCDYGSRYTVEFSTKAP